MRDIIIKKEFEKAKSGDKEAKTLLFKHYYKAYSELFELNKGIPNIKEEYARIINESIDKYFASLPKIDLSAYITTQLYTYIKNYNGRRNLKRKESEEISNLLKEAKASDESRKLLIEKCMYLIDEYLISAQFDSNFTKEDAKQEGYLLLTRRVNAFLDSHQESGLEYGPFTIYLRQAIDKTYLNLILRERQKEKEHQEVKEMLSRKDEFKEFETEFEFIDYVKNLDLNNSIKDSVIKSIYYTKTEIGQEENLTRQAIEQRVESKKVLIKKFFD